MMKIFNPLTGEFEPTPVTKLEYDKEKELREMTNAELIQRIMELEFALTSILGGQVGGN